MLTVDLPTLSACVCRSDCDHPEYRRFTFSGLFHTGQAITCEGLADNTASAVLFDHPRSNVVLIGCCNPEYVSNSQHGGVSLELCYLDMIGSGRCQLPRSLGSGGH